MPSILAICLSCLVALPARAAVSAYEAFPRPSAAVTAGRTVIDVRSETEFKAGHIRGAVQLPEALYSEAVSTRRTDRLALFAAGVGLKPESRVLVCGGAGDGVVRAAAAAFLFVRLGIRDVAVLDGGFPRWSESRLPVDSRGGELLPARWSKRTDDTVVTAAAARKLVAKGASLVDVRPPDEYFGLGTSPGHIRGSRLVPLAFLRKGGSFMPGDDMKNVFFQAGISSLTTVILVPGDREEACCMAFLLRNVLGFSKVKLLDGGMETWSSSLVRYSWQ